MATVKVMAAVKAGMASLHPTRLWERLDAASRAVIVLALVAALGPIGEILDVAVFAEFETDLILFDFGLDAVATFLLPVYYLALLLLAVSTAARGIAEFACARPMVPCRVRSRRLPPPQKIPIL